MTGKTVSTRLDPQPFPYNNRGGVYIKLGRYEEALRDFDKAIELSGGFPAAYYNRGMAHSALGHFSETIADYDMAISLSPDYWEAYNNKGWFLYEQKKINEARGLLGAPGWGAPFLYRLCEPGRSLHGARTI